MHAFPLNAVSITMGAVIQEPCRETGMAGTYARLKDGVFGIVLVEPLSCFIGLFQMFRRNTEGDVSAGGKCVALRTPYRQADQGILPWRKQSQAECEGQFEVTPKTLTVFPGDIANKA